MERSTRKRSFAEMSQDETNDEQPATLLPVFEPSEPICSWEEFCEQLEETSERTYNYSTNKAVNQVLKKYRLLEDEEQFLEGWTKLMDCVSERVKGFGHLNSEIGEETFVVGWLYANEVGVERSLPIAITLIRIAAAEGSASGLTALGEFHDTNKAPDLVELDERKAIELYQKAIEKQEHEVALMKLGQHYLYGTGGLPRDLHKAIGFFQRACSEESGDPVAQYNMGVAYRDGAGGLAKDLCQAAEMFRRATLQGNVWACYTLGGMYAAGAGGLPKDSERAYAMFKAAAEAGLAEAMITVARIHRKGLYGKRHNMTKAVRWLERAAQGGDVNAVVCLADIYYEGGDGVERDHNKARELYEAGVAKGHPQAFAGLGVLFYHGALTPEGRPDKSGFKSDKVKAAELILKAAEKGVVSAHINLAIMYSREGDGVEKDLHRSVNHLMIAALGGHAGALRDVATIYHEGDIVHEDEAKSVQFDLIAHHRESEEKAKAEA